MKGHITKEQLSDSLKNELSEFSSQLESIDKKKEEYEPEVINAFFDVGDVRRYGMICNGVVDETELLNDILSSSLNNIYFPTNREVKLSNTVKLPRNKNIFGYNTTLKFYGSDYNAIEFIGYGGSSNNKFIKICDLTIDGINRQDLGMSQENKTAIIFNKDLTSEDNNLSRINFNNVSICNFSNVLVFGSRQYINSFENCSFMYNNNVLLRGTEYNPITDSGENISFKSCVFANSDVFVRGYYDEMNFSHCSFDYPRKQFFNITGGRFRISQCRIEWGNEILTSSEIPFDLNAITLGINMEFDCCRFLGKKQCIFDNLFRQTQSGVYINNVSIRNSEHYDLAPSSGVIANTQNKNCFFDIKHSKFNGNAVSGSGIYGVNSKQDMKNCISFEIYKKSGYVSDKSDYMITKTVDQTGLFGSSDKYIITKNNSEPGNEVRLLIPNPEQRPVQANIQYRTDSNYNCYVTVLDLNHNKEVVQTHPGSLTLTSSYQRIDKIDKNNFILGKNGSVYTCINFNINNFSASGESFEILIDSIFLV